MRFRPPGISTGVSDLKMYGNFIMGSMCVCNFFAGVQILERNPHRLRHQHCRLPKGRLIIRSASGEPTAPKECEPSRRVLATCVVRQPLDYVHTVRRRVLRRVLGERGADLLVRRVRIAVARYDADACCGAVGQERWSGRAPWLKGSISNLSPSFQPK